MADFEIGEAIGVGTGLITRRPLAVLAWGLLPAIIFFPLFLLLAGLAMSMIARASQAGTDQSAAAAAMLPEIGAIVLLGLLAILIAWALSGMITAAAFRAVLRPEQSAFGYLRFGTEELWLIAVSFAMGLVLAGVGLVATVATSILSVSVINAPVSEQVTISLISVLVREAVTIWVWLRLCLALPMTFAHGRFFLFESWALTRGHTVKLLGFAVLAVLIVIAIELVAVILGGCGLFALAGGSIAAMRADPQTFFAHPRAVLTALAPVLALWAVLGVIVSGVSTAIFRAPLAHIYRSLAPTDPAAEFT